MIKIYTCFNLLILLSLSLAAQDNFYFEVDRINPKKISIIQQPSGKLFHFHPAFSLIETQKDPGLHYGRYRKDLGPITSVAWNDINGNKTHNIFKSGKLTTFFVENFQKIQEGAVWYLSTQSQHKLKVNFSFNKQENTPVIRYEFTPAYTGYFSVAFHGIPSSDKSHVDAIWQPFVWQEKRFPPEPLLSVEEMCPVPATLVERDNFSIGVMANPEEIPYRLPSMELGEVKFGVAIRNQKGAVQPQIFAPVLGNPDSYLNKGQNYKFSFFIIAHPGNIDQTYRHLATEYLQFRDHRENVHWSLNETLENMVDYAMNDTHSGWYEELKGFDYSTDVKRSVKVVSSLHPLSLAYVMDSEDIFRRRALPMIEYILSRERYLFSIYADVGGQNVSSRMKGPAVEVSELAALYDFSGHQTPIFMHFADSLKHVTRELNLHKKSPGDSWPNLVALYQSTGQQEYLQQAIGKADQYIVERIETPQANLKSAELENSGQFWTDFAPLWMELLSLYELTGKDRYLEAAYQGAQQYLQYIWFHPVIPEDSMITINPDGVVDFRCHEGVREDMPLMTAPAQKVPAWRVSEIGLTPEACNTFPSNPAIFLTSFAPHLLRVAYYKNDDFLRAVARSAVIGRYKNYPGYDINGIFNTVYSSPDYPERPLDEISYNQVYYNHVWPQIAMLTDYLVSDTFVQSEGKVAFPSLFAEGYAYLKSKVYGHQTGTFYNQEEVRLWMPTDMLKLNHPQVNYLSAINQDNLCLAFTNQSEQSFEFEVSLNPDVVPVNEEKVYPVTIWEENQIVGTGELREGKFKMHIAPKGITAITIEGIKVQPHLKANDSHYNSGEAEYKILDSPAGKIYSSIIDFGNGFPRFYLWSEASQEQLKKIDLHCQIDEQPLKTMTDNSFPFEFSIPLNGENELLKIKVHVELSTGKFFTETFELKP